MNRQTQKVACLPEKKKMEALSRLSCNIAHDINNILGGIGGFASLAMGRIEENDPLMHDLQEIQASVDKAAALAKQLVVFGGSQMQRRALCDVNGVIANVLKRPELVPGGDFQIDARPGPELPGIMADFSQLEQALANLLVNAREAMVGGGTAVIRSSALQLECPDINSPNAQAAGSLFVKISVEDSGPGISAEVFERLFEPFFSTRKKGNGAGLGLSTVYGAAKQHNGWVEVKSEPGRGSEFSLFLPVMSKRYQVPF